MSELTITLLRLGYLALLWVFVFAAIGVLRKDIYGTHITTRTTRARASSESGTGQNTGTGHGSTNGHGRATGPSRLVVTHGALTGTTAGLPRARSCLTMTTHRPGTRASSRKELTGLLKTWARRTGLSSARSAWLSPRFCR